MDRRFDDALPTRLSRNLMDLLRKRVQAKGPSREKLAQLSLAALLNLLDPNKGDQLRRLLEPIEGAISRLSEEAICDQVGFVPALFALEGIALLQPSVRVFTPMVRASLLSKSEAYEEIGPAIEYLSRRV